MISNIILEHIDGPGVDYGVCSVFDRYEFYNSLIEAFNNVKGNCYITYENKGFNI